MIKINNVEISEEAFNKIAEQYGYVKQVNKNKRWRAKEKELYYTLASDGYVNSYIEGDDFSNTLYLIGNYFKTQEEAQAYWARILARQRIIDRLRELEGDWVADWNNQTQRKYTASYKHRDKQLIVFYDSAWQYTDSELYSSIEAWEQVIEEMPDDVKLMLGISDD